MQFGIIGLGRMGANIARHAIEKGHHAVGYSRDEAGMNELAAEGLEAASSPEDFVRRLTPPRIIFIYVPHGQPTEEVCDTARVLLEAADIVVDGGNSHWEDSRRRHAMFAAAGISFVDLGTSGGITGARTGASFTAGGDADAFEAIAPLLRDLAADPHAVIHAGGPGAGHFVKLIHNAIEFGMVQAIGEGVEMLERSDYDLDVAGLFENWSHGSVIRGWLVELMHKALSETSDSKGLSTYVEDTEEVKWVLKWALDKDIPTPVTSQAQEELMQYRDLDWPAAKAVALLRHQYGGHPVHQIADTPART